MKITKKKNKKDSLKQGPGYGSAKSSKFKIEFMSEEEEKEK